MFSQVRVFRSSVITLCCFIVGWEWGETEAREGVGEEAGCAKILLRGAGEGGRKLQGPRWVGVGWAGGGEGEKVSRLTLRAEYDI